MNRILLACFITVISTYLAHTQPGYDYSQPFLATSQLGFRENSPKEVVFYAGKEVNTVPDKIPFFVTYVGYRLPREQKKVPKEWKIPGNVFRYPINTYLEPYTKDVKTAQHKDALFVGVLKKVTTNWGVFWKGDFSDFETPGNYQIENEYGFTAPFQIADKVYDRLQRGYLEYLFTQRSGVEIPGIRPEENADDARLDIDSTYYMPVAGGWNNAGDWRKWLFLTLPNLDALGQIVQFGHLAFKEKALEEIDWGNRYYHHMITDKGQVYEDVGGGINRAGDYNSSWWNENHPGVTASGDTDFDNIPMNGIERQVRTNYNPLVQYQFVRHQALASTLLKGAQKNNALVLADRAWKFAVSQPDDQRTIFVAQKLLASIELFIAGSPSVSTSTIENIAEELLSRQHRVKKSLQGYFMEKNNTDAYRSIAFSVEPALALLRLVEANISELSTINQKAKQAVINYVDNYLLADAQTNPYQLPPYGVYLTPPYQESQQFRKTVDGRFVRTFIHIFSDKPIPHGINQVFLQQGYLMARAGKKLQKKDWQQAAERILNWSMGYNPYGLCLFTGVGFKHPIPASFMNYKIPSAAMNGFIGTPDDQPYIETRNLVEWSTQEAWDVPYTYAIGLISYLD
ncbi:glycoside hydrolase family 9 protein [Aquimarina sp. U1-2]|uniref:glycoside hydrolase family 9 protein n=1 Tax=Aquimarina sp. U1-2 TaxID=2823141 RepID=UPI001AECC192|nr:glycoside hydrolase family 9 protein [Aquimarina sp. U1-2]MBP2832891.1 glycoside hydrolase family 9 protein [Aquimarina sp. U1-2]